MSESPYTPPKARIDPPVRSDQGLIERPREIVLAIQLTIFGYVLGWAGLLVSWDLQMSLQTPGQFLLTQAIGIAIVVWIFYKIYQGRNWARILLLVSVLLGSIMFFVPTTTEVIKATPIVVKMSMIANYIIDVVVLWLLFISPGKHWFDKRLRSGAT